MGKSNAGTVRNWGSDGQLIDVADLPEGSRYTMQVRSSLRAATDYPNHWDKLPEVEGYAQCVLTYLRCLLLSLPFEECRTKLSDSERSSLKFLRSSAALSLQNPMVPLSMNILATTLSMAQRVCSLRISDNENVWEFWPNDGNWGYAEMRADFKRLPSISDAQERWRHLFIWTTSACNSPAWEKVSDSSSFVCRKQDKEPISGLNGTKVSSTANHSIGSCSGGWR